MGFWGATQGGVARPELRPIAEGATVEPEPLFSGGPPYYAIDNMEGLALCQRNGETRVTLLSDNNFFPNIQRTLLLQFSYQE